MKLMNKIKGLILVLLLGSLFTACSNEEVILSQEQCVTEETMCLEFNAAVDASSPTLSTLEVLDNCSMRLDKDAFSSFVLRYENLLIEKQPEFSNKIFNRGSHEILYDLFPDEFDSSRIILSEDPEFRSILNELVISGYTLRKSEKGLYKVEIDYSFFRQFDDFISEDISGYFKIMDRELKHPMFGEHNILGTPFEMQIRLNHIDQYINEHPKSVRLGELSVVANQYLLALVFGYQDSDPYDEDSKIKDTYKEVYTFFANKEEQSLMNSFIKGLVEALEKSSDLWNRDVYDYIIGHPEIYMKRYLNSSVYPEAFVDVGFGWTVDRDLYYYPVFTGIDNASEQGKLNLMARSIVEKRLLGEGFDGTYTGGKYIWSNYDVTFNRRNWISLKYDIYIEQPNGQNYWTIESMNYDLSRNKKIFFNDVLKNRTQREIIDDIVKSFFEESRTYYAVSLDSFYKDPNPNYYMTNTGITLLIPLDESAETNERIVEIFIPFEKFGTRVEYIYKFPHN